MVVIGLGLLFSKKKPASSSDGRTPEEIEREKMKNEEPDIWQRFFGLVDDTDNVMRAVVTGDENSGKIIDYIAPGERYNWTTHRMEAFVEKDPVNLFLLKYFSKRVYGRPFFDSLRPLNIDRVVKKPTTMRSSSLLELLDAKSVKRYGLYKEGMRPIYLENIDAGDGIRFNVICWATFEVFDPDPAFRIYKDNFLPDASEIVSTYLSSKVLNSSWDQYKVIANNGTVFLLDELNPLLKKMGIKITQIRMSDPELNASIQEVMVEKKRAIIRAEAVVAESLGTRDAAINVANGEAEAIERLAIASKAPFEELTAVYISKGYGPMEAAKIANGMIAIRQNTEAIGKLKVYVASGNGTGVNLNVPTD